ncbi:MAG: hypothetical protein ACE5QW_03285 [Thermoplasmata archaeon]
MEPSRKWIDHEVDEARIIRSDGSFLEVDEKLWRGMLVETLFGNSMTKKRLMTLADEHFDRIISVKSDY